MSAAAGQTSARGERPGFGDIDLAAIGRAIWARRLWVAVPTALAMAGAFAAVNFAQPTYRSEARILVESGENAYTRPEADRSSGAERAIDQEAVLSQVQVIQSRDIARQVSQRLELLGKPEFDPALRSVNPVKRVLILLGLAENPLSMTAEERVLRAYYERLAAYQVDKSRIIAVQFESQDPGLAADAANAVAAQFLEAQQSAKRSQTRNAGQWLSGEVDALRKKVEEAEGRVESFRARANLFVGSNNVSLTAQQLADINGQIAAARAQQTDAQTRSRLLRDFLRSGRPIEAGDVANSEIIRRLNEQRLSVTAQLAEQSSTLGPRHPRIAELQAQRTNLDSQIRVEAEKLVRILENDARLAGARFEALQQNLDQAKRQAAEASEQEVQLRVLEREAKSLRDQLEGLLARYRDASARDSAGAVSADARIISRAIVSNVPAFPKKLPVIFLTTLGTFILAIGCVTTAALLASPVPAGRAEAEGETVPGLADTPAPPLAPVEGEEEPMQPVAPPQAPDALRMSGAEAEAAGSFQETDPLADAGNVPMPDSIAALASLLVEQPADSRRTLIVGAGEGQVVAGVGLALARELAAGGSRTALVDLDARTAALAWLLPAGARGIGDFAAGAASFGDILHADPHSPVHVVPLGQPAAKAGEEAEFVIEALSRGYDNVVIVAGILPESAAPMEALAALGTDAVIVAENDAAEPAVTGALRRLARVGLRSAVVVVVAEQEALAA